MKSLFPSRTLALLAAAMLGAPELSATDWTGFRGGRGDGVAEARIPQPLNAQSIAWSVALPGRGLSSPLIIGDRVYVTSSSGPRQDRLHVLCFRLSDGQSVWERQFWATGRTTTHEKISGATPSPTSDGHSIFALFSSNDCVALDLDGNLQWFRGLGRDYPDASNSLGMSSALRIVDGILIAQVECEGDSFVAGLDGKTGVNRWKLDRPRKANWTSPIVYSTADGVSVVALQSAQGVMAIDPATGKTLWTYTDGASTTASTTMQGRRLFVPSQGLTVLEPSATAGEPPKQLWRNAQLRPGTPSPLVLGERVYVLNDGGILSCGDLADGKRLWQLRLKGRFSATPVAAGGRIYCVNEAGSVQVVDPTAPEGAVVGELELADTIIGTPSIAADSLFVRSDNKLWRLGRATTP